MKKQIYFCEELSDFLKEVDNSSLYLSMLIMDNIKKEDPEKYNEILQKFKGYKKHSTQQFKIRKLLGVL